MFMGICLIPLTFCHLSHFEWCSSCCHFWLVQHFGWNIPKHNLRVIWCQRYNAQHLEDIVHQHWLWSGIIFSTTQFNIFMNFLCRHYIFSPFSKVSLLTLKSFIMWCLQKNYIITLYITWSADRESKTCQRETTSRRSTERKRRIRKKDGRVTRASSGITGCFGK